ncbi:hypothetical protein BX070DRAFT_250864 [Coemansia spiralis]|nr:hypothetical protein BX070DRAFT_250864 [Coemansia spiralis]
MGFAKRASTAVKVQAPKRVIRAVRNYVARESAELTFKKDDFFYVLSTPHENDQWYDVTNPLSGERGLVPSSYFEVMESRQDRINRINRSGSNASTTVASLPSSYTAGSSLAHPLVASNDSTGRALLGIPHSVPAGSAINDTQRLGSNGQSSQRRPSEGYALAEAVSGLSLRTRATSIQQQHHSHHQRQPSLPANSQPSAPMLVIVEPRGTALYGFDAANGNELTVHEGEDLLIVAQSTDDWLIAKSVNGSSGIAGLVPASYIQLRDHISGAVVSDLQTYLTRYHMRLRTATEWDRHQREKWASHSTSSSVSTISDIAGRAANITSSSAIRPISRTHSPASSTYEDDRSTSPRSSIGSIPGGYGVTIQKSRTRALTTSSSTSSIAERSSFRQLHKGRQPSGSSFQNTSSDNFEPFYADEFYTVRVPSFICKDGAYLFQILLKLRSGEERNLYRSYEDFISCRNQLRDSFPKETSPLKLARFSMHNSSMLYLNDAIAERRRNEIEEYVNGLLHDMPEEVVESQIVQRLFGSRTSAMTDNPSHQLPQQQHLPQHQHQQVPDRNVQRTPQPTLRSKHTPTQSTDSTSETAFTPASASKNGVIGSERHKTESAGITHRQLAHKSSMAGLSANGSTVKVKVKLGNDMVALRLPFELTLSELKARIASKLGNDESDKLLSSISQIMYHAPSGEAALLSNDQDWSTALTVTNYKPVLTIVQ